jgi:hypothetical protein
MCRSRCRLAGHVDCDGACENADIDPALAKLPTLQARPESDMAMPNQIGIRRLECDGMRVYTKGPLQRVYNIIEWLRHWPFGS